MWTFLVELAAVEDQIAGNLYPETLFSHGDLMRQKKKTLKQMILRANLKTI
jgi:hypothetical protein